jgi:hypothetical protein
MGRACSLYGVEQRRVQGVDGETWRRENTLEKRRAWGKKINMGLWSMKYFSK